MQPYVPALRILDIRPIYHEGHPSILLRDPLQLADRQLIIPHPLAAVLQFCDGRSTVDSMCQRYQAAHRLALPRRLVQELVDALDEAAMLNNVRAQARHAQALEEYRSLSFRPSTLAGVGYPAHTNALRQHLNGYLAGATDVEPLALDWTRHPGLLSPHIDYPRGGAVYARVWQRAVLAAQQAELVILIGTDHYGNDPITLTCQNYATPYGVLPTAAGIVQHLAQAAGGEKAFAGELRHRGEHSLELVAVWLHHMRGGAPVELVPLLVGSFHRFLGKATPPSTDPLISRVLAALRSAASGRRTLIVASGDLAHVGPAFGGAPLTRISRSHVQEADERLLAQMSAGDAEGFFGEIRRYEDRYNVCGVAPIYLAMSLLECLPGECVAYATCPADEANTSAVTVAGVVFG
jgi:hypothetical protein